MSIIKKYRVRSKSNPDTSHIIECHETFMMCDCQAYLYKSDCSHVKFVKQHLKAQSEKIQYVEVQG